MSILSKLTGIHVSPHGVHIEPLKAIGTVAGLGMIPGVGSLAGGLLSKIPGLGSLGGAVGGALSHIPGASSLGDFAGGLMKKLPGILGSAGSFIGNHGMDLGMLGAAGLQAKEAHDLRNRASGLQDQAIARGEARWNGQAPLRDRAMSGLLNQQRPDLSATFSQPRNPYAPGYVPRVSRLPLVGGR